jgi:hypothetical protein
MLKRIPRIGQRVKCDGIRGTITAYVPARMVGTRTYTRAYEVRLDNGVGVVGSKYQFDLVKRPAVDGR